MKEQVLKYKENAKQNKFVENVLLSLNADHTLDKIQSLEYGAEKPKKKDVLLDILSVIRLLDVKSQKW